MPENNVFRKIKNKQRMVAWLMRQYFNPDNNENSLWYKKSITHNNVLNHISNPKSGFPLTPAQLADMWKTMESFKKHLKKSEKELGEDLGLSKDDIQTIEAEAAHAAIKYQTGEVTLVNIGKVLGGLTPTMINKLASSGVEKFRTLTNGKSFETMETEQAELLNKKISEYRFDAAFEFATDLKKSGGNIKRFLSGLVRKQIFTPNDIKLTTNNEIEQLLYLIEDDINTIAYKLLRDIEHPHNIFKSFQAAVSRKAFPAKRRGRPKKIVEKQ